MPLLADDNNRKSPYVSPWSAIVRVLYAPGRTFRVLGDSPPIVPGYLVGSVAMLPMFYGIMRMLWETQVVQIQTSPGAFGTVVFFMGLFGIAGPWIAGAMVSLVAMIIGRQMGGHVRFGQYYGMVGYARLPLHLGVVLVAGLNLAGLEGFSGRNPLSLAGLLPEGSSPFLVALAGAIEPFELWYFALLAFGFSTLHKVRTARGAVLPVLMFLQGLGWDFFMIVRRAP